MNALKKAFAALLMLLAAGAAQAQKTPKYQIERYTLDNGLRVVLSEDHSLPMISTAVGYDVGSRNEVKGKTGFAHLFEHMMFQGSAHLKKGDYFKKISDSGGTMNGTTYEEMTNYQCSVPREKLPLVLWMEADRMRSLAVNAENLKNQKDVVKEEKRMRLDDNPLSAAFLKYRDLVYANYSNSHMPIGLMEDLDAAPLEYVQYFFNTYYVPNNAVLVVAGDFDPKQAKEFIKQYFGPIPRKPNPPKPDLTEVNQTKMRRDTMIIPNIPISQMMLAWPIPSIDSPELPALIVLHELLFGGKDARADSDIGAGEHFAAFRGNVEAHRGPSLFGVETLFDPEKNPDKLIDEIFVQILRVQNEPPDKDELNRLKANYLVGKYRAECEPLMERAVEICHYTLLMDKPEEAYQIYEQIQAVTPEQVQAVAKKYLIRDTLNVLIVKNKEEEKK